MAKPMPPLEPEQQKGGEDAANPAPDGAEDAAGDAPPAAGDGFAAAAGAAAPPPILDGTETSLENLSPEVVDIISQSPTLAQQIADNPETIIEFGPEGEGTYFVRDDNRIVIDGGITEPGEIVQSVAHEMGHALDAGPDLSSVDAFVDSQLAGEGAATLNNLRVREELLGTIDIGVAGNPENHARYNEVLGNLVDEDITEEEARRQIGNIFGSTERPSTAPDMTYDEYYRGWAEDNIP
jgi:type VI secretion system secreted protein VgrG